MRQLRLLLALILCPCAAFSQNADQPVHIASEVANILAVQKVPPVYPQPAKEQHMAGAVELHAIIGKDGHVQNLTVISGPPIFRASAMDSVRQWVYRPYLLNGEPVEVDTTVTIHYNLGDSPTASSPTAAERAGNPPNTRPLGPMRVSGGVMAGLILSKVNPVYPENAKANGIAGMVVMHAIIAKDGSIASLAVISGPEELRQASLDAVSQWLYKPFLLNGQPTEIDTTVNVNFTLGPGPR